MEAQKDIAYYKKKYADEEGKVKEAKGVAEIVEEEFEVGFFFLCCCVVDLSVLELDEESRRVL